MHSFSAARESIGNMEKTGANLSKSLGRLSSGLKLKNDEDAGGLAVSSKLDSVISRSAAIAKNLQNGLSFLESQDAAQSRLGAIISRMSELRHRYDDITLNAGDKNNLNREFMELKDEINSVGQSKFNGISLFSNQSDPQSKLVVNTASDSRPTLGKISRSVFFNSILDTSATAGPIGANLTVQGSNGFFADATISPTGGSTPDINIQGQQGVTPQVTNLQASNGTTGPFNVTAALSGTPAPPFTIGATLGNAPQALWQENFNNLFFGFHRLSPVFDNNGDIIVGTINDDELYRLDPNDGRILTTYDMGSGGNLSWKSAVTSDSVYSANGNGNELFAFDKILGNQKWSKALNNKTQCPPFVHSNGNIYIATDTQGGQSGRVYGFKPNGDNLANFPVTTSGTFRGGFAEAPDGTLYLTSLRNNNTDTNLISIDPTSGTVNWTKQKSQINQIYRAPAVAADGSVVINSFNGVTRAFNANGSDKWTYAHPPAAGLTSAPEIRGTPTIDTATNTVFVASQNGIVALRDNGTTTPQVLWDFATGFDANTVTPAFDLNRNLVYVANTATGEIIALDASGGGSPNGSEQWRYNTGSGVIASPALDANGNVYIGNTNAEFIAVSVFDYIENPADTQGIGSGYDPSDPPPAIIIEGTDRGNLAATATVNDGTSGPAGTLNLSFTGKASGTGNLTVTVKNIAGTPPPIDPVGIGDSPFETPPAARILASELSSSSTALRTNLVSLMDGNSPAPVGGGTILDSSGNGQHGTVAINQAPGHETANRRTGTGSFFFDGSDDKITLGDLDAAIGGQDKLTLSTWVYREGTGQEKLICKSSSANDADHVFSLGVIDAGVGQAKLRMHLGTDSMVATAMDGSITFPNQEWTHLAMTYDGNELRSYVNGELDSNVFSVNGTIKSSTEQVTIGNLNSTGSMHFDGMLDDVAIWNRTLSASEVETLAGPGNLTATASINPNGSLKVTPAGNPATDGSFAVEVEPGILHLPKLSGIGSGYDSGETQPSFTITGADSGPVTTGTATINSGGTLDINFQTITPIGTGPLTLNIDPGTVRAPPNRSGVGSGYIQGDPVPTVSFLGGNQGTLQVPPSSVTIESDGTLTFSFAGAPTDTTPLTMQVSDGIPRLSNLSSVGTGYALGETPAFTLVGSGPNFTGNATTNSDGTLEVDLSTVNPTDFSNLTIKIANGIVQAPTDLNGLGANHTPSSPPSATISGSNVGSLIANPSVNSDGTVNIAFSGTPLGTGPLTLQISGGSPEGIVSNKYLLEMDGNLWDYSVAEFENFSQLISDARAQNGAEQNSLGTSWELLSTNLNQLQKANGRIKDADYAKEMTNLGKSQILNQSAAMTLGQQNRITSEALLTIQRLKNKL